jgi:N-carbamoyl-L-amino-acid hydrolase
METAKFGAATRGGVCRLTLSDADRQVRNWFVRECQSIGCAVTIDTMGNIFARRQGRDDTLPPLAVGSHLDTQPSGGKFDGILGVLSGLEVARTLAEVGHITRAPLEVIDWTNEEGSRFSPPMLGSGVFAGVFDLDFAHAVQDRAGSRFGDELERIGYRGGARCGDHRLGAYFEYHIEQGPVLEAEGTDIGVVTGMQGQRWYEISVVGREGHAGTTPMPMRKDAMVASARLIQMINTIALRHAPQAVATVGLVEVRPNSRNVIPGSVFFTVDFRHPEENALGEMDEELKQAVQDVSGDMAMEVGLDNNWNAASMGFNDRCIDTVSAAAGDLGLSHRDIVSGAGHDAVYIARVAPTGMIFVPCRGGISHNELEAASPGDIEKGANVLLNAVLAYDESR